jgi:hypothetical protein
MPRGRPKGSTNKPKTDFKETKAKTKAKGNKIEADASAKI